MTEDIEDNPAPKESAKGDDNIIFFRPRVESSVPPFKKQPPMINLPLATKILAGILSLVHLGLWGISSTFYPAASDIAIRYGALIPAFWTGAGEVFHLWTPLTLITFSLIHGGWLHIGVNLLMLVAMGSGLEKALGLKNFMFVYWGGTILAAAAHIALAPSSMLPVIGASGGVSALFGGYILFAQKQQYNHFGVSKSILPIVALWIGVSILAGIMGAPNGSPVAWVAHIGGFLAGIGIMMFVLRQR